MEYSPDIKKFLELVEQEAGLYRVKLLLSKESHVESGSILCNGYFSDEPKPTLAVAMGKPIEQWLPILVHEYCHMRQWIEQSPYWTGNKLGKFEATDIIDMWLQDMVELSDSQKDLYFSKVIMVEKDCEERVVKLIKQFNLPIDPELYTQKANAYVLFYNVVKKYRKWYRPNQEPYNLAHIYEIMPKDFSGEYLSITEDQETALFLSLV